MSRVSRAGSSRGGSSRGRLARGALASVVVAAVLGLAGCGAPPAAPDTRGPSSSAATATATGSASAPPSAGSGSASAGESTADQPAYSDWQLGATALPTDAAGQGVVRPTPKALRVRRFPTTDLLPPPAGGRFRGTVAPITPAIRARMGATWMPGCPVPLADLRYLTVSFRGFDGRAHTGEIVVAARVARDVVSVFRSLYAAGYPIEEMRLPTTADLEAPPTGDGNNTAGMVCRTARGSTTLSAHAYGLAVDVNPFLNPYRKGDRVLPELASAYLDRSRSQPGIIHAGDVVVRAFERIGWTWGGSWNSLKDYQHFSATGR